MAVRTQNASPISLGGEATAPTEAVPRAEGVPHAAAGSQARTTVAATAAATVDASPNEVKCSPRNLAQVRSFTLATTAIQTYSPEWGVSFATREVSLVQNHLRRLLIDRPPDGRRGCHD